MENTKRKYILQTPIQFSFDIPALNITRLNIPHEVSLTDEEVLILRQSIPNIKIVPNQPTIPSGVEVKASVETPKIEPEPTIEQTIEVVTTVTQDVPVSEANPDGTNNAVKSSYLSVTEASVIIKNAKSKEDLEGFLSDGESRKGILEEYNKRLKELNQ